MINIYVNLLVCKLSKFALKLCFVDNFDKFYNVVDNIDIIIIL